MVSPNATSSWTSKFIYLLYSERIRPICLPLFEPLRSQDLVGYAPFVAGWGSTLYQGPQSNFLRDVQLPIISLSDCARNYKSYFPNQEFDERVLCAGYGGRDTCQGDSGGPLMLPQVCQHVTYSQNTSLNNFFSANYFRNCPDKMVFTTFSLDLCHMGTNVLVKAFRAFIPECQPTCHGFNSIYIRIDEYHMFCNYFFILTPHQANEW